MNDEIVRAPSTGISRRTVLASGLAVGAAVAAGQLILPDAAGAAGTPLYVRPTSGADDGPAIQAAIDRAAAAGGGTVTLAAGTFLIGTSLQLRSKVTLKGAGRKATILSNDASLGANPILTIAGTTDVHICDLGITNGMASIGAYIPGQDGVHVSDAARVAFTRVRVSEIAGTYGVLVATTDRLSIASTDFYRCTYAMVSVLPDCTDIAVTNSTFDTVTSTAYPNTYTFATGYTGYNSGVNWPRGLQVTDCAFLNNPRWEGLDTHGSQDVVFAGNHIENVRGGIIIGNNPDVVQHPVLDNVLVENNTVIQGNGLAGYYGICVTGNATRGRNITIRGNTVQGFSGLDSRVGAINVFRVEDVTIDRNIVRDYGMNAICMYYGVFGARIHNNTLHNLGAHVTTQPTAGITAAEWGCYGVDVAGNRLISDSTAQQPDYFVRAGATNQSWQIGSNVIRGGVAVAEYGNPGYLPVYKEVLPTAPGLQQKHGDILWGENWRDRRWKVCSPNSGYGATDTETVVVAVSMDAGSASATIVPGGAYDWTALPPGMNVVIEGAGEAGAQLLARVVSNTGTMSAGDHQPSPPVITFDRPAASTVAAAAVRFQALEFAAV